MNDRTPDELVVLGMAIVFVVLLGLILTGVVVM